MEGTQKDKVILTGATGSMGAAAARALSAEGYLVIMACRNVQKAEELRQQILREQPDAQLEVRALELSSPASIRSFVDGLQGQRISALFCNAGVKTHQSTMTPEGIELDYATNYLGNRLLTLLLLPLMEQGARIDIMVSLTTKFAHLDLQWNRQTPKDFRQLGTYGSSKLALMLFAIALGKRHPELRINVSDPGVVNSDMISMKKWYDPLADIFFRPFIKTPEQGVYPALQALRSDLTLHYFVGHKARPIPSRFLDSPLVEQLWQQAKTFEMWN